MPCFSKLPTLGVVVTVAVAGLIQPSTAQFDVDQEGVLRRVIAESSVLLSGTEESAEDSNSNSSIEAGGFVSLVSVDIDELGFSTEAHADQLSFIGPELIYGFGSGGYFFSPTPPDGLVSCTGISDLSVPFEVTEPVSVAYEASVQDNPVSPTPASSILFLGPDGFAVTVSATASGPNSASFTGTLEPGSYSIQAESIAVTTDAASPDASVAAIGSWSFELRIVDPCPEDLTGDGLINSDDLFVLLGDWGTAGSGSDLNGDGTVNSDDLFQLLGAWGPCPN